MTLQVKIIYIKSFLFLDTTFCAEDIPEDNWTHLSQSESEYEPSQESVYDSEQVQIMLLYFISVSDIDKL